MRFLTEIGPLVVMVCPAMRLRGAMDVTSFLKKIGDVLSERRTGARELGALEFAADGRGLSIPVRIKPHGHGPGVGLLRLSRIAFLGDEVRGEPRCAAQQPAKVHRFSIEGVLGAAAPEQTPLERVAARLARSGD